MENLDLEILNMIAAFEDEIDAPDFDADDDNEELD